MNSQDTDYITYIYPSDSDRTCGIIVRSSMSYNDFSFFGRPVSVRNVSASYRLILMIDRER